MMRTTFVLATSLLASVAWLKIRWSSSPQHVNNCSVSIRRSRSISNSFV